MMILMNFAQTSAFSSNGTCAPPPPPPPLAGACWQQGGSSHTLSGGHAAEKKGGGEERDVERRVEGRGVGEVILRNGSNREVDGVGRGGLVTDCLGLSSSLTLVSLDSRLVTRAV
jgi:hypothetical protein